MAELISRKFLSLAFLLIVSLSLGAQKPAETVPAFQFYKFDGTKFTDKNLAAKQLLFFCFFDITCEHCRHAITTINKEHAKFKGTSLYLISLDNKEGVQAFLKKYGPVLPGKKNVMLLHDTQNEFIYKFKPKKYPSMFLYSQNRKLMLYDDDEKNVNKFLEKIQTSAH